MNKHKNFVLHIEEWDKNNVAYSKKDMCELKEKYSISKSNLICDECDIEINKEDSIETIEGKTLCFGCDSKRLSNE